MRFSPWGLFDNTFPFPIHLPLPLSFLCSLSLLFPVLGRLPCPLPIHCSLPFAGPFFTALHVILTLAVIILIAIAMMAPSTAWRSAICPVLMIIILLNYDIPIELSNGDQVPGLVLPAAWRHNLCLGIMATISRKTLAGVFELP